MDDFNALMNSITNVYLAGMGLPPLPEPAAAQVPIPKGADAGSGAPALASPAGPEAGSPLWNRLRKPDVHDFRDRGNPLEKMHPDTRHWSRWPERTEFDWREP